MWAYFSKLTPKVEARRFDDNAGNRFYYFGDKVAAGITTVFGAVSTEREYIEKWKLDNPNWRELLDKSALYGSIEHEVFADIMTGKGVDERKITEMTKIITSVGGSKNTPKKDVLSFLKWTEDVKLEPLVIEGVLVWEDKDGEYLAMTIDLLAKAQVEVKERVQTGVISRGKNKGMGKFKTQTVRKEKVLSVDFKSNFFEKERKSYFEGHKMQLIGAAKAVYQNFNIEVDEMYNWSPNNWKSSPEYTFYRHNITDQDIKTWNAYWELAKVKGYNIPKGRILKTELRDSQDYQFLTYKEFVKTL